MRTRRHAPVLVVQNNTGNRHSGTTIISAIACKRKLVLPTHVMIPDTPGIKESPIVLLEQLHTIVKARLTENVCSLNAKQRHLVYIALLASLGIQSVPQEPALMALCKTCAQSFRNSESYRLRQISTTQDTKESCTICNIRTGYDFEVTRL